MTTTAQRDDQDRFDHLLDVMGSVLDPALDVLDAMTRVVDACVQWTAATEAGIVLADQSGTLHVIASTSERSIDAEEAQLGTNEGSCLDCFRTGGTIDVPDVSTKAAEWPTFSQVMHERGFVGTFAEPVRLRTATIGSLCVFADHDRGHDDRDVVVIQLLADAASAALVRHREEGAQRTLDEQIGDALEARVLLEQAKGALAYRRDVRIDEAFRVLRDGAGRTGRGLRELAEDVVERGSDLREIA
ncbi:transcriptional regulator [Curtobacterium sp. MCPF17_047]|uniref:ANTAR domain-containing protein n=1 Tax=unclassified Curtobacterium TaxID=257496 RepID=UPI000DA86AEB|nr:MULTISPECIES: ANTAR domain-containing protein [unclassified Curtobacterium]PZE61489.1 transcriptional regulator [Curtobacterium sp. MCPF17_001]PZF66993.1 transcriptional regulator [Curtobacterium sp. MCPF17_047]WIB11700.1 ANTAR domain-containing protein [Curtobacterium sp. MCPF17_052]